MKTKGDNIVAMLKDSAFWVTFNANDLFAYACADGVDVEIEDLDLALRLYQTYGQDGITALLAKIRGQEPLASYRTEQYKAARVQLEIDPPKTDI